jgi:transcription elongation factor SPT4
MSRADGNYVPAGSHRHLRACMVCSIVQTQQRFQAQGCPNCDHFLEMAGSSEAVLECTSSVFEGLITLADPSQSWVAKWQRLDGYVPGVYAVKVSGVVSNDSFCRLGAGNEDRRELLTTSDQLPEEVVAQVERNGVKYIP